MMKAEQANRFHAAHDRPRRPLGRLAIRFAATVLGIGFALSACQPTGANGAGAALSASSQASMANAAPQASAVKQSSQGSYALGIVGYNYTEVGIADYSVNGTGAFNLAVSNGDAGGGKTACCFGWAPAAKLPMPIRIEWTRDGDTWCRSTVMLRSPGPVEPTTFEVHFYQNRHIEVAITDQYSAARVNLQRAGGDFRVGRNVQQELKDAVQRDAEATECRPGRFPIGGTS